MRGGREVSLVWCSTGIVRYCDGAVPVRYWYDIASAQCQSPEVLVGQAV